MCFSATASFTSSAILLASGFYAVYKFNSDNKKKYLSLIPIFFGIQQFSEGVVWLGLSGYISEQIYRPSIYLFSFFATSFWPFFIPFALAKYERQRVRKGILIFFTFFGFFLGAFLFYRSSISHYLDAYITCNDLACHSISYTYDLPFFKSAANYLYSIPVLIPFFFSSSVWLRYLSGTCFLASFFFSTYLAKDLTFPSIWCFFAALMSMSIIVSLLMEEKAAGNNNSKQ
jgi:heme A synthase